MPDHSCVYERPGGATACFLRSGPEHHSFAVFRASQARFDHFSLQAVCWNDIGDWADNFSRIAAPLFWGPGRHEPGNNLILMARDPEGNAMEIPAEIERIETDRRRGEWPTTSARAICGGQGWLRS